MMPILKTLLILTVYELTKYVAEQIIVYIQTNDDIDQTPIDYEIDAWKRY